jgi:hypothetical protein
MAHENKQSDLPNCKSSKFWIKLLWYGFGVFWEVGLQQEIDDCFASDGLGNVFVVFIPLAQEFANVLVHFTPVWPFHVHSSEVEKSEWVHLGAGLVPSDLRYHAVSERVVSFLSPQFSISSFISLILIGLGMSGESNRRVFLIMSIMNRRATRSK